MERPCIACGGTGYEEHCDRTLPAPPCRLCHPVEAEEHQALARRTRNVSAEGRLSAYHALRIASRPGALSGL